jgi:hypothetical protein
MVFRPTCRHKTLCYSLLPDRPWSAPSLLANGYIAPLVQSGTGVELSTACSVGIKNPWSYTSIPVYTFMVWYLIGARTTLSLQLIIMMMIIIINIRVVTGG